jgi:hypothetical protein
VKAWLVPLAACLGVANCVDQPIGDPAGSNNYDDPDDPGTPGVVSSAPDAAGDASGRPCLGARDCPAVYLCAYPIDAGCDASGRCILNEAAPGCDTDYACACDDTVINMCAPEGYASAPIISIGACGAGDADASDAGSD